MDTVIAPLAVVVHGAPARASVTMDREPSDRP